jgi:hypothetical protein
MVLGNNTIYDFRSLLNTTHTSVIDFIKEAFNDDIDKLIFPIESNPLATMAEKYSRCKPCAVKVPNWKAEYKSDFSRVTAQNMMQEAVWRGVYNKFPSPGDFEYDWITLEPK